MIIPDTASPATSTLQLNLSFLIISTLKVRSNFNVFTSFFHYIQVFVLLTHLHLTWQFIDPSLIFFSTRWQCWRPSELCEIKVNSRDTYPFMTNNLDCRGHSIPGTISFFCNRNSWHNLTKRFPCCCYFNGLFALVLALAPASVCLFVCLYPLVRKDIKLTLTH